MTAPDLIIYSIDNGMIGKNGVSHASIGDVTVSGDFATGEFLSNGKPSKIFMHFYKEERVWKIDLTSVLKASAFAFKQVIEKSGLSENEYISKTLETAYQNTGNNIWKLVR
jgi:hypothetical protein